MRLSDRIANALALDTFDKKHKIGLSLLVLAMIAVVVVWSIQLQKNIVGPLYATSNSNQTNTTLSQQDQSQVELKTKDTDGDGLNDWDELNLYKTSPYLADTDSDGFSDKQEIESGNNPTCPEGQSCTTTTTPTTNSQTSDFNNPALENLLNQNTSTSNTVTPTTAPSTSNPLSEQEKNALRETLGTNPAATELRQYLLKAGMEQKTLDLLSDEEILATFNEMIK